MKLKRNLELDIFLCLISLRGKILDPWIDRISDAFSDKTKNKIRLKIRQLKEMFSNENKIQKLILTIASEYYLGKQVGAYFLKIEGVRRDAVFASEGYVEDSRAAHLLSPLLYALLYLQVLELGEFPLQIYCLSDEMFNFSGVLCQRDRIEQAVVCLIDHFKSISWSLCKQGRIFEQMQSKMYQLKHHQIGEVVSFDFLAVANLIMEDQ